MMANQEDINRARQGKDHWNEWAEKNPDTEVDFSGAELDGFRFDGFLFPSHARFERAHFQDTVSFNGATFRGVAAFRGARFQGVAEFGGVVFQGSAIFGDATFQGFTAFGGTRFQGVAEFTGARFQGSATFRGATFQGSVSFEGRTFEMQADFVDTTFDGRAVFENATFDRTAVFTDANFNRHASFISCSFATIPAFHGATLHEDTTFEGAAWPEPPYEGQSAYDAARAWGRLRVEMSRLHRHEDELFFFERELGERARDTNNEPLAKRLLYRIYLVLGAGRSVAKPLGWLLGLNAVLFLPIYWFATSAIQWRNLPIRDFVADVGNFRIPADVVSITIGQALPFIGSSNPERADLYRRLFPHGESNGIDVPFWLEIAGIFQQLSGLVLLFMIGLALRNRFRMK